MNEAERRDLVYRAVDDLLAQEAPDERRELEEDFDLLWEELRVPVDAEPGGAAEPGGEGLPISPGEAAAVSLLTSATWAAALLVNAMARRLAEGRPARDRELERRVDARLPHEELGTKIGARLHALVAGDGGESDEGGPPGASGGDDLFASREVGVEGSRLGPLAASAPPPLPTAAPGTGGGSPGGAAPDAGSAPPAAHSAEGADTEIVVRRERRDGRVVLHYWLRDAEAYQRRLGSVELDVAPAAFFEHLRTAVQDIARAGGADPATAEERLRSRGAELFAKLVPRSLRETLWALHDGARGGTPPALTLLSEEPWIPWELVKLHGRPGDRHAEGPFLADGFRLTRGLADRRTPARLDLRRPVVVVAGDADLPAATHERRLLSETLDGLEEVPARPRPLLEAFAEGHHGCFHFVCHGDNALEGDEDRSSLRLEEGTRLTPADLHGRAARLGEAQPLVFLNACHGGRGGLSLTGLGGWAPTFLGHGAAAFLGPLWAVPDHRAYSFAEAFYRHLLDGEPLASAVLAARRELARSAPADPTRLAYAVWGHPHATVVGTD